eukprot:1804323-Rhodomonas_salina.1
MDEAKLHKSHTQPRVRTRAWEQGHGLIAVGPGTHLALALHRRSLLSPDGGYFRFRGPCELFHWFNH